MSIYKCNLCNKEFNKKNHLDNHLYKKKKSCVLFPQKAPPNPAKTRQNTDKLPPKSAKTPPISAKTPPNPTKTLINTQEMIDLLFKEPINDNNNKHCIICIYCEKIFTRSDSLKKHQSNRCKSKTNHDDLEKLKEKMDMILENYENLKKDYQDLIKNKEIKTNLHEEKNINEGRTIFNNTNNGNNNNNNNNNNINNGIINTVNIVQFGEEDISKLNLPEAVKQYLISTGGNIASNMLKYINLNEKYPENHNICITDISRELVKIHNGKKFITKKFKNAKNDIMKNVVKNTRKIMDNYENNDNLKKSADIKTKLKINDVSLKLIDGVSGEDIVREEIKEKDKLLNYKNNSNKDMDIHEDTDIDTDSESEEREFTFDERLRIEHLDKKKDGLQIKTFENLKEELYNARELLNEIN